MHNITYRYKRLKTFGLTKEKQRRKLEKQLIIKCNGSSLTSVLKPELCPKMINEMNESADFHSNSYLF